MTAKTSKQLKRLAKKKKVASRKRAASLARIGRVQFGRKLSSAEWGVLVHKANVPLSKLHPDDFDKTKEEMAKLSEEGILASVKMREDGSFLIIETPQPFDTAVEAYEDGLVDPLDIMVDGGLPAQTKYLGFVVCNGDGKFISPDGVDLTEAPEKALMFEDQMAAHERANTIERGFVSMVFDTGANVVLAVVMPG
ncbi:TPA: hypothetical protein ACGSTL_001410 [Vibrio parahaemolyticus]